MAQFEKLAIAEVSEILMGQFVVSLEAKLTETQGAPPVTAVVIVLIVR